MESYIEDGEFCTNVDTDSTEDDYYPQPEMPLSDEIVKERTADTYRFTEFLVGESSNAT